MADKNIQMTQRDSANQNWDNLYPVTKSGNVKMNSGNDLETDFSGKISHSLATAANDFLVASGVGAFVKKTLAEVKTILGLGSAAYTNSTAYATAAQGTKADNALPASSYMASDVLTKLKTVDGTGSGVDADLLDGNEASAFATAAQGTLATNALPASSYTAADVVAKLKTVDGAGSGVDADLLDGNEASAFATAAQGTLATNAMPKSGGTFTSAVSMGRQNLNQPQIKDYSETVVTNAAATGSVLLNIASGNVFNETLTGATTFSFGNPATTGQCCSVTVIVNQGATAYAVTWPAAVSWDSGTVPDISTASKTYVLVFTTFNAGTRWYGRLALGGMIT